VLCQPQVSLQPLGHRQVFNWQGASVHKLIGKLQLLATEDHSEPHTIAGSARSNAQDPLHGPRFGSRGGLLDHDITRGANRLLQFSFAVFTECWRGPRENVQSVSL
jgi:hypothetical protein